MSRPPARFERIAFMASRAPEAEAARTALVRRYGDADPPTADVIVALGGDGFMLQTLHKFMNSGKPIYGMHRGTVGFLMNEFQEEGLRERLAAAEITHIRPLVMVARDADGRTHEVPRHQRGVAVPPERAGRAPAHPDRRPGAARRARRRRRAGGDAGRLHRL